MAAVESQADDPCPSKGPVTNVRALTVQSHCLAPPGGCSLLVLLLPAHPRFPDSPHYSPAVATTSMPSDHSPHPPSPHHHLWEALPGFSGRHWGKLRSPSGGLRPKVRIYRLRKARQTHEMSWTVSLMARLSSAINVLCLLRIAGASGRARWASRCWQLAAHPPSSFRNASRVAGQVAVGPQTPSWDRRGARWQMGPPSGSATFKPGQGDRQLHEPLLTLRTPRPRLGHQLI